MHNLSPLLHQTQLYQTQQIKELERLVIEKQRLSVKILMERAGRAAWLVLQKKWPTAKRIVVVCGKGNNAGDGYVVARLAHEGGLEVSVLCVVGVEKLQGAAKEAALLCEETGVSLLSFAAEKLQGAEVMVDALLGTGLVGEVQNAFAQAIVAMNAADAPILALDVPSGLEADTGNVVGVDAGVSTGRVAVKAAVTVTFIAHKCGLHTGFAREFCGEIICAELGLDPALFELVKPSTKMLDLDALLRSALPKRSRISHKGDFGHVLVLGGNIGMGGAARMAAEAAARVGAGLVSVATRAEHVWAINAACPELMCYGIDDEEQLNSLLDKSTVVVLGPGLGQDQWANMLFGAVISYTQARSLPLVIDADALNLLAKYCDDRGGEDGKFAHLSRSNNWILTPHPGEAARLLGESTSVVQSNRFVALASLEQKFGGIWVLKGAGTLVSGAEVSVAENGEIELVGVCTAGNPGMASGGMGDVLSGIIGGLVAQRFGAARSSAGSRALAGENKIELARAAQLGVCLHSCAADLAARETGEIGLLATDLLPFVRRLVNNNE